MSLRLFVSSCSVILIAWMAVAFFNEGAGRPDAEQAPVLQVQQVDELNPRMHGVIENEGLAVSVSP